MTTAAPRAWQRMLSGRRLDLLDPSPLDVEIEDIALGLSRVARWNGQTVGAHPFSVAQHSLLVVDLLTARRARAESRLLLAGLLHDAAEYVTSDLITPFKNAIGPSYRAVEQRLTRAIHLRFGLPAELPETWRHPIKRADAVAAYAEAVSLAGFTAEEARRVLRFRGAAPPPVDPARSPEDARHAFLERFERLRRSSR